MKDFKPVLLLVIPMSFLFGLWWGFKAIERRQLNQTDTVRLLAYKETIPPELIAHLHTNSKARLSIDWVEDTLTWRQKLASGTYDIVTIYHHQVDTHADAGAITRWPDWKSQLDQRISTDFKKMPYDPTGAFTLPFLWGAHGFLINTETAESSLESWDDVWKKDQPQKVATQPATVLSDLIAGGRFDEAWFKKENSNVLRKEMRILRDQLDFSQDPLRLLKEDKASIVYTSHGRAMRFLKNHKYDFNFADKLISLWVVSLSITPHGLGKPEVRDVVDFLFSDQSAYLLVSKLPHASTLKTIDASQLHSMLKPSYLRQLPLRKVRFTQSLQDELKILNEFLKEKADEKTLAKTKATKSRRR